MLLSKLVKIIIKNSIIYFVLFLYLFLYETNAQGFQWQYSARLPVEIPKFYYGINFNYGIVSSNGSFNFSEDGIICPSFKNGTGGVLSFGLNGEYWDNNQIAYVFSVNYLKYNIFCSFIDYVPISNTVTASYEDKLKLDFSNILLKAGLKYRILNSHFHIGAGIDFGAAFNSTFAVTEKIIGPDNMPPFSTNPPSYERDIINGNFDKLNIFVFYPSISIGYDLQIGRGKYITPTMSLYIPLFDFTKNDNVKNLLLLFGIKSSFNFL